MVLGVRVVGTVVHSWTRGRDFVASVHMVGEVEMKPSRCKTERSIEKELGCKNRHFTYGGKATRKRMHLYLAAGRTPISLRKPSHESSHVRRAC